VFTHSADDLKVWAAEKEAKKLIIEVATKKKVARLEGRTVLRDKTNQVTAESSGGEKEGVPPRFGAAVLAAMTAGQSTCSVMDGSMATAENTGSVARNERVALPPTAVPAAVKQAVVPDAVAKEKEHCTGYIDSFKVGQKKQVYFKTEYIRQQMQTNWQTPYPEPLPHPELGLWCEVHARPSATSVVFISEQARIKKGKKVGYRAFDVNVEHMLTGLVRFK